MPPPARDPPRSTAAPETWKPTSPGTTPEVVVLSAREVLRGHDGVGASVHRLRRAATKGMCSYGYVLQVGAHPVDDPARMPGMATGT
ncbi:hypothetical protein [Blastococcus sp. SYSU DS0533]